VICFPLSCAQITWAFAWPYQCSAREQWEDGMGNLVLSQVLSDWRQFFLLVRQELRFSCSYPDDNPPPVSRLNELLQLSEKISDIMAELCDSWKSCSSSRIQSCQYTLAARAANPHLARSTSSEPGFLSIDSYVRLRVWCHLHMLSLGPLKSPEVSGTTCLRRHPISYPDAVV